MTSFLLAAVLCTPVPEYSAKVDVIVVNIEYCSSVIWDGKKERVYYYTEETISFWNELVIFPNIKINILRGKGYFDIDQLTKCTDGYCVTICEFDENGYQYNMDVLSKKLLFVHSVKTNYIDNIRSNSILIESHFKEIKNVK